MDGLNMYRLLKVVMFIGILYSGMTETSKEYFKQPGDTVILLCTLTKETIPITWSKSIGNNASSMYSSDKTINHRLPNATKSRLSIKEPYDLQISSIQREDEGTYECSTSIGGQLKSHSAILSIVRPPTNVSIQNVKDGKVSGTEGQILALNCVAIDGKPPPEVKLTISGVNVSVTGNQSVQYTKQHVTRDFDRQIITCSADHSALTVKMETTVIIDLDLKPLKPTFSQTNISTEETIPLTVSCTSQGSRPPASFQWYMGSTNVTTFASDTKLQSADTYTVKSTLNYKVNRSQNGKQLICKVTNKADPVGTEESRQLDVRYAPDITVENQTYTQNDAIRPVTCNPSGNPDMYTYHGWQHKSKYGEIIREFTGIKILRLPDSQEGLRYQSSGEYICIASNGVKDNNNKFNQTGSGYVIVKAQTVFTTDTIERVKQFGELGKAVEIYVNVYSDPKFTSYRWDCNGKTITLNSAKYESRTNPTIVMDKMYGKTVQLDGYNVTLLIQDLEADDLANYTVTFESGFAVVRHTIILESASVPETPGNFSKIASSSTSIIVQWDPNSNGGYVQTFYVQYRVKGLLQWSFVSAGEEDINETKKRRTYEIKNLQEGKAYELRMYAENTAMKRSNVTKVLIAFTDSGAGLSVAAIIGGIAGGLTAIIIVLLIIVFVQKKRKESGTPSTKLRATSGEGEEDEEEDGLKDNILYESSQSDGLKKNILYQSADLNDDHSAGKKNQKKPSISSEYGSVQKPNAIYAEVNKVTQPKNAKGKKQKDKKEKPKKTRKEKAKGLNNNPEEEYANSALQLKNLDDGEYANSSDTQGPSGHHTNAQGLEYADLTFRPIPTQNKMQVIHGVDDRTIYADVDHTKKAPPPPQESEYEETNIKHGKMA